MAQKLNVHLTDINGETSGTKFWCNDVPTAILALQNIANLSNAQITSAYMTQPLSLTGYTLKANALAANVETALNRVKVHMSGADVGSVANPRDDAILGIPAPIGDLVNGLEGSPTDARLTPLIGVIMTAADVTTDRIDRVFYSRGKQ